MLSVVGCSMLMCIPHKLRKKDDGAEALVYQHIYERTIGMKLHLIEMLQIIKTYQIKTKKNETWFCYS